MNELRSSIALNRREFMTAGGAVLVSNIRPIEDPHPSLHIRTQMAAPQWAMLQRELLRVHTEACESFHARYFDQRNHLLCFPRWGTNDGPDDAIEHVNDWPLLYSLGGSNRILQLYQAVYEGRLEQYGALRTKEVPSDRQGQAAGDSGGHVGGFHSHGAEP